VGCDAKAERSSAGGGNRSASNHGARGRQGSASPHAPRGKQGSASPPRGRQGSASPSRGKHASSAHHGGGPSRDWQPFQVAMEHLYWTTCRDRTGGACRQRSCRAVAALRHQSCVEFDSLPVIPA
jgi:hypothetical protein